MFKNINLSYLSSIKNMLSLLWTQMPLPEMRVSVIESGSGNPKWNHLPPQELLSSQLLGFPAKLRHVQILASISNMVALTPYFQNSKKMHPIKYLYTLAMSTMKNVCKRLIFKKGPFCKTKLNLKSKAWVCNPSKLPLWGWVGGGGVSVLQNASNMTSSRPFSSCLCLSRGCGDTDLRALCSILHHFKGRKLSAKENNATIIILKHSLA